MKQLSMYSWAMMLVLFVSLFNACKKDDPEPEVIASFSYVVDANDYKVVAFTNTAQNFASLSWNFGDGTAASAELNPSHTFATTGEFTVTLTATSPGGATDMYSEKITIADPNVELTKLAGDGTKTWKLLRQVTADRFPALVMPYDRSSFWWGIGLNNNELSVRTCMLNDEWTFGRDLSMVYNANGDYWAEGGLFTPDNQCASTSSMVSPTGQDLSAWGNGNHTFVLTNGANPTLEVVGLGAFIGLCKAGTDLEYKVPQPSVKYNIVKLYDGDVDTLIIEAPYKFNATDESYGGIWQFVLVHYDDPSQEPPMPGPKPTVGFTYVINGLTVNCTNTTTNGVTYAWDFGDGSTSTAQDPSHTYATEGIYNIKLTATNPNGEATTTQMAFISQTTITDALLQGAPWHVSVGDLTVFVGPGLGSSAWWVCPKANLDGTNAGTTDDWSCLPDDEFTFHADGTFSYDTKGSTRNDGYFGGTNGCIDDAGIAASANGAPLGSFAGHTYTLTPGTGSSRPIITITSPAGHAAFIGFYKGYNGVASGIKGGENNGTDPVNFGSPTNTYEVMGYANTGTKEYLFVSVDITGDHSGGSAWSMIMER